MCLPGHYLCWAGNNDRADMGASLTLQEEVLYIWDIWDKDFVIYVPVDDLAPHGARPSSGI